jgi:hypothetical protein
MINISSPPRLRYRDYSATGQTLAFATSLDASIIRSWNAWPNHKHVHRTLIQELPKVVSETRGVHQHEAPGPSTGTGSSFAHRRRHRRSPSLPSVTRGALSLLRPGPKARFYPCYQWPTDRPSMRQVRPMKPSNCALIALSSEDKGGTSDATDSSFNALRRLSGGKRTEPSHCL